MSIGNPKSSRRKSEINDEVKKFEEALESRNVSDEIKELFGKLDALGEKTDRKFSQAFSEQGFALASFLGGVTIASMVLVMQSKSDFIYAPVSKLFFYPDFLITGLAIIGFLFIGAALVMASCISPWETPLLISPHELGYSLQVTLQRV